MRPVASHVSDGGAEVMRRRQVVQDVPMKVFVAKGQRAEPYIVGVFAKRDDALAAALEADPQFGVVEEWVLR